ncbi:MAG TPA: type II toxin-antitoxin system VapC family toxin [Allosphingosinicella sp.]
MIVVDASLAVKWILFEAESDLANSFKSAFLNELSAPDLLSIEVTSAIVRKGNMGQIGSDDALAALGEWTRALLGHLVHLHPTTSRRLNESAKLALSMAHPFKDCIYLALAMELDCDLATCDEKFKDKAVHLYPRVRLLDEFSPERTK